MSVANLDLCQELYDLSNWEAPLWYFRDVFSTEVIVDTWGPSIDTWENVCPAYDLGYLLRKQNATFELTYDFIGSPPRLQWAASGGEHITFVANTPEDAVCKLAIELFKNGVLTRREAAS